MRACVLIFVFLFTMGLSVAVALERVAPIAFSPHDSPQVTLSNADGREIVCLLTNYDFKREELQIRLVATNQLMWISPSILSESSQAEVADWKMKKAIYDYVTIDGQRSKNKNSGASARYDVKIRNMGRVDIDGVDVQYRLYKKSTGHSSSIGLQRAENGMMYVSGLQKIPSLDVGNPLVEFTTGALAINKTKSKTTSTTTTYYTTGGSSSAVTGVKNESNRDSLKGLVIHVYYKGDLIRKWYSDRTLEGLAKW